MVLNVFSVAPVASPSLLKMPAQFWSIRFENPGVERDGLGRTSDLGRLSNVFIPCGGNKGLHVPFPINGNNWKPLDQKNISIPSGLNEDLGLISVCWPDICMKITSFPPLPVLAIMPFVAAFLFIRTWFVMLYCWLVLLQHTVPFSN